MLSSIGTKGNESLTQQKYALEAIVINALSTTTRTSRMKISENQIGFVLSAKAFAIVQDAFAKINLQKCEHIYFQWEGLQSTYETIKVRQISYLGNIGLTSLKLYALQMI